jgi:hypothetical protein
MNEADVGAGTDYEGLMGISPFNHDAGVELASGIRANAGTRSFLGCVVSAPTITNVSGTCTIEVDSMGGARTTAAAGLIAPTTGSHFSAIYRPALHLAEAASQTEGYMNTSLRSGAAGVGYRVNMKDAGVSDQFLGLSGVNVLSAPHWRDFDVVTNPLQYDPGGTTHDRGPVAGGLTIYPIPPVDTHSAATTVREILVPMGMRVHGVTFMATTSGAGNGLRLNVRRGASTTNITPIQSMVSAGFEAVQVLPVGGDDQFIASNTRDLERGDTLILLKSGTNAMTGAQAFLICTPKEHFNVDARRDRDITVPATAADVPPRNNARSWSQQRSVSGPCLGGIAYIPLGQWTTGASESDTVETSVPMPFSGEVLAFVTGNRETVATGDTHAVTLRNNTKTTNIVALDDLYYYYSYNYYASGFQLATWDGGGEATPAIALADRSFDVGDIMQVRCTTGVGETFNNSQAGIYVRVTGFPAHRAIFD